MSSFSIRKSGGCVLLNMTPTKASALFAINLILVIHYGLTQSDSKSSETTAARNYRPKKYFQPPLASDKGIRKIEATVNQSLKPCFYIDSIFSCYEYYSKAISGKRKCACGGQCEQCEINNSNELFLLNFCITYDEVNNLTEVGLCYFIQTKRISYQHLRHTSELNNLTCGSDKFNRTGTLCSKCRDGHYPLAYSYDLNCVQCPNGKSNWWKFVLAAFLPLTVFYFIVVFFKVNVTSSYLQGFVFYAQIFTTPSVMLVLLVSIHDEYYPQLVFRWVATMYSVWNLDFFRLLIPGICLGTDTLQTLALDFAIGVYPLYLVVLTYLLIRLHDHNFKPLVIMWRPFQAVLSLFQSNWDVRTSLIDAFATFFLLANVKILNASFDMLVPVRVYQLDSSGHLNSSWRLYVNATVPYFQQRHIPYAVLAITMLLLFMALPVLLLILYPFRWFQRFLNLFPVRWYILHTFVDSFQGCYKDGTQPGTRDCRWFASLMLLARPLHLLAAGLTAGVMFYVFSMIIVILIVILLITTQPFKDHLRGHCYINALFFLLLASWDMVAIGEVLSKLFRSNVVVYLFVGMTSCLPLLYIFAIVLLWMYKNRRFGLGILHRLWGRGYESLQ